MPIWRGRLGRVADVRCECSVRRPADTPRGVVELIGAERDHGAPDSVETGTPLMLIGSPGATKRVPGLRGRGFSQEVAG